MNRGARYPALHVETAGAVRVASRLDRRKQCCTAIWFLLPPADLQNVNLTMRHVAVPFDFNFAFPITSVREISESRS